MANITAEVRRLTYSTRNAFETATSAVSQPISAFITGENHLVIGFKASGNYRYIRAVDADLAYQQSFLSSLQSSINSITDQLQILPQINISKKAKNTSIGFTAQDFILQYGYESANLFTEEYGLRGDQWILSNWWMPGNTIKITHDWLWTDPGDAYMEFDLAFALDPEYHVGNLPTVGNGIGGLSLQDSDIIRYETQIEVGEILSGPQATFRAFHFVTNMRNGTRTASDAAHVMDVHTISIANNVYIQYTSTLSPEATTVAQLMDYNVVRIGPCP